MMQAKQLWEKLIRKQAADPFQHNEFGLLPGADEEQWKSLIQLLQADIPIQFKEFYSVHNGQHDAMGVTPLIRNLIWMPIHSIIETWQFLNEEVELDSMEVNKGNGVKPYVWNPRWIPIAGNGSGDYLCLDTDPDQDGVYGQVLYFWHDWEERSAEADSLFAFLELCLAEEESN